MLDEQKDLSKGAVVWLKFPEDNIYFKPDLKIGFQMNKDDLSLTPLRDIKYPKKIIFNIDTNNKVITEALPVDRAGIVSISFTVVKKDSIQRILDEGHPDFFGSYYSKFSTHPQPKFGLIWRFNNVIPGSEIISDQLYQDKKSDPTMFIHCPDSGNEFTPLCYLQSNRPEIQGSGNGINSEVLIEMMINQKDLPQWEAVYREALGIAREHVLVDRAD